MKLTKQQLKKQKQIWELIQSKDDFTDEETERIYKDFNEGYIGDITDNSAYFTPWNLALDFALMVPTHGTVVDLCAGIGGLAKAALIRDTYNSHIRTMICIERDKRYIKIGKKLVKSNDKTKVVWLQADMFDYDVWKRIDSEYGKIDCLISNPPFGKVSKTDKNRSWLKYNGNELDIAAIEIGIKKAEFPSYILPQGSCTFKGSGRPYFDHCENKKIDKLKKEMGIDFYMAWASIDTSIYEEGFKNTKVVVECLSITDVEEVSK